MSNISIIVAVGENYEIGKDNQLLWHISDDLKHFKSITTGKPVIMGENTWYSLPIKPLPKRRNIVLTKNIDLKIENVELAFSIDEVLKLTKNEEEVFVIGGAMVYKQFIEIAQKLYITHVFKNFEADTRFPEIDCNIWEIKEKSDIFTDENSGLDYQFINYIRK